MVQYEEALELAVRYDGGSARERTTELAQQAAPYLSKMDMEARSAWCELALEAHHRLGDLRGEAELLRLVETEYKLRAPRLERVLEAYAKRSNETLMTIGLGEILLFIYRATGNVEAGIATHRRLLKALSSVDMPASVERDVRMRHVGALLELHSLRGEFLSALRLWRQLVSIREGGLLARIIRERNRLLKVLIGGFIGIAPYFAGLVIYELIAGLVAAPLNTFGVDSGVTLLVSAAVASSLISWLLVRWLHPEPSDIFPILTVTLVAWRLLAQLIHQSPVATALLVVTLLWLSYRSGQPPFARSYVRKLATLSGRIRWQTARIVGELS